jgi:arsenite-transporting ATPase
MMNNRFMPHNGTTRFIFFSGKGGVGKSTMSCATAVWNAQQGRKTLLVTTDPAPNLSDIFEQEIGHTITSINSIDNLFAIEISPDAASDEYRERIIEPMRALMDEKTIAVVKEQMNSPCVEEVAAFDKFIEFMDDPKYDVVVFDTAPTGHTVRLLELPSGWSSEISKGGATCVGPSASLLQSKARYDKAISYLQDTDRTTFVFVMKPEQLSLNETRRSVAELSKLKIPTSMLIVNGCLPDEAVTDSFFANRKKRENEIIAKAKKAFDAPKFFFPLLDSEIKGAAPLFAVGSYIFDDNKDALSVLSGRSDSPEPGKVFVKNKREIQGAIEKMIPHNGETKYLFFTGKGGVGKSTFASATALLLSAKGFKTLIVTTDPAAHLEELFGQPVEHEPSLLKGNSYLYLARIDQKKALVEYKNRILKAVADKDESTRKSVEEDLNSPCAEEMAAFEKFLNYFDSREYQIIIFDTAPTGHTLRLLELPKDWKGFIDLGTLTTETSAETKEKYNRIIDTMKDPDKSIFVFVMYPEYTPMMEAKRAADELQKQVGIHASFVAVNYILPPNYGNNEFFHNRRNQQLNYLQEIKKTFELPMITAPLLEAEPKGISQLKTLTNIIYN